MQLLNKDTLKQEVALEVAAAVIEETLLEADWREDEPEESRARKLEEEAGLEGLAVWCVRASPSSGHSYYWNEASQQSSSVLPPNVWLTRVRVCPKNPV